MHSNPIDTDRASARRTEVLIALALGLTTLFILFQTTNIGFSRDEGFYFQYAAQYQDWFVALEEDLAEGSLDAAGREEVNATWRHNAEHPPLAKILFGHSWRHLAEKRRPVDDWRVESGNLLLRVHGLRRADGFQVGEEIAVLAPLHDSSPTDSEQRVIAHARVIRATHGSAHAQIDGPMQLDEISRICAADPAKIPRLITGCEAATVQDLGGLSEVTAMRLPTMILAALLVATIHLFGSALGLGWGGVFAALAFLFAPRHFFHAHLACFDLAIAALSFWTIAAFWLSLRRGRGWAIATGVLWGLALLTKHNALLIPVLLGLWWLTGARMRGDREERTPTPTLLFLFLIIGALSAALIVWMGVVGWIVLGVGWTALIGSVALGVVLPRVPAAFVAMSVCGPLLLIAGWPRLWHDTWGNLQWYLDFHLSHAHYMQVYFGEVLGYPPFPVSFPFVMTALTLPIVPLALGLLGITLLIRRRWRREEPSSDKPLSETRLDLFLGLQILGPFLLIALPSSPIFGGIKHWLPAMPFFCLLAGLGFEWILRQIHRRSPWPHTLSAIALLGLLIAPGFHATAHVHPHGTAFYNGLIGGEAGAADLGMQRQFWGYSTREGMDWLNKHVPAGGLVYFHKSHRGCWKMYRRDGLLRHDIRHLADIFDMDQLERSLKNTTHAIHHHQKDHDEYELAIWRAYGTTQPVFRFEHDGVPILSIYENPSD